MKLETEDKVFKVNSSHWINCFSDRWVLRPAGWVYRDLCRDCLLPPSSPCFHLSNHVFRLVLFTLLLLPVRKPREILNSHRRFLPVSSFFSLSARLLVSCLRIVTWSSGHSAGFFMAHGFTNSSSLWALQCFEYFVHLWKPVCLCLFILVFNKSHLTRQQFCFLLRVVRHTVGNFSKQKGFYPPLL